MQQEKWILLDFTGELTGGTTQCIIMCLFKLP